MQTGDFRATVIGVLTGDTFLVKYSSQTQEQYAVIVLPVACAPSPSIFLRGQPSDPFAVESLEFFQSFMQDKRVLIGPALSFERPSTFVHQNLGELKVTSNPVKLADDPASDIDGIMISNGYARIRSGITLSPFWKEKYEAYEKVAMDNRSGMWGAPRPVIDSMVAVEFESSIVGVNGDFSFRLLEPQIDVELAGVCIREVPGIDRFLGERVLFHRVSVRVLQRFVTCPFLVTIFLEGHNLSEVLLRQKFAVPNPLTSRFLSGILEARTFEKYMGFRGVVTKIINSSSVEVKTSFGNITVKLAWVHCPVFDGKGTSEPHGWEAWKLLRDTLLNEQVNVEVQHYEGDKVVCGQIFLRDDNVNELILREGLAKVSVSRIHAVPKNFEQLGLATDSALAKKIGIFGPAPVHPPNPGIGTVMDILSPIELSVWMFEEGGGAMKKVCLIDLTSSSHDYLCFSSVIESLREKFLHHDIEILSNGIVIEKKTREDLRICAASSGIFKISEKCRVKSLKAAAKSSGQRTNLFDQPVNTSNACVVTNVISNTRLVLQYQSEALSTVQDVLRQAVLKRHANALTSQSLYVLKINGKKFRALALNEKQLYLIDFGFVVERSLGETFACPDAIRGIPAQALVVDLAFIREFTTDIRSVWNLLDGREYQLEVVQDGIVPKVALLDLSEGKLVQSVLVAEGFALLDSSCQKQHKYHRELTEMEEMAKGARKGGWSE